MEPLAPPLPTFLIIGAQKSATRWLRLNLGLHPAVFTAVARDRVLQQRRPLPGRGHRLVPRAVRRLGRRGDRRRGDAGLHVLAASSGRRVRTHRGDASRRAPDRDAAQPDRPGAVGDGAPHRGRHAPARLRAHRPRAARRRPNATGSGSSRAVGTPRASSRTRSASAIASSSCSTTTSTTTRAACTTPRCATSARPPTSCRPSSSGCASATSSRPRRSRAAGR